jgi:hypothetical protein
MSVTIVEMRAMLEMCMNYLDNLEETSRVEKCRVRVDEISPLTNDTSDEESTKSSCSAMKKADAEKEAEKDAKKAEKEAAKEVEKEAKKAAKEAAKEVEKEAKKAAKEAAKEVEKEAKKAAKEAEKDAKKAAKEVEKEAKKAAKEAKKVKKPTSKPVMYPIGAIVPGHCCAYVTVGGVKGMCRSQKSTGDYCKRHSSKRAESPKNPAKEVEKYWRTDLTKFGVPDGDWDSQITFIEEEMEARGVTGVTVPREKPEGSKRGRRPRRRSSTSSESTECTQNAESKEAESTQAAEITQAAESTQAVDHFAHSPLPDGMTLTPLSEEDKKITEEHKSPDELTGNFATYAKDAKEAYDAVLLAADSVVAEEHQYPTEMLDKLKTLDGFGLVNDEGGNSYFHRLSDNTLYGGDGVQVKYYYESGSVVEMTTEHPNYPASDSDSGSETETDSESDSD